MSDPIKFGASYRGRSVILERGATIEAAIATESRDGGPRLRARLNEPLLWRAALASLFGIVRADARRAPKDRAAYLAHKSARGEAAAGALFEAQRAFHEIQAGLDALYDLLDPVVTVHPDALIFEVLSKDGASYARLSIDEEALAIEGEPSWGTTNCDFSQPLYDGVRQIRAETEVRLSVGPDAVELAVGDEPAVVEKAIEVPASWVRGFLQVQAAAASLEGAPARCCLAPVDLYNILRHLRLHADRKKGGRALRLELTPGARPRVVLEPWEEVFETHAEPWGGRDAVLVKIWGRRRLAALERLLPWADDVEIASLGSGLPSFAIVRCGPITFTLGMTGFGAADWSRQLQMDALLPRSSAASDESKRVVAWLGKHWSAPLEAIAEGCELSAADARRALIEACQDGLAMYGPSDRLWRSRPLDHVPEPDALAFRDERERLARDWLEGRGGSITIESEEEAPGGGTHYVAAVRVEADRRTYRVAMTIDAEGRASRVDDTSPHFEKHGLKEGPSAPLIALRWAIAERALERAARRGALDIESEVRSYVKRDASGIEQVWTVALRGRRVQTEWGPRGAARPRAQRMRFGTLEQARRAYFERVASLEERGFMDATAGAEGGGV